MSDTNSTEPVKTTIGCISGIFDSKRKTLKFLGIPYAEAPIGALRFKAPVPKKPFGDIFAAHEFGAAGPQVFDPSEGDYEEFTGEKINEGGREWVGSEDNLTLNIITPEIGGKRPVVVWIHGGANWLESSRLYTYRGDDLVENGDVVFVSLNYRLGIFGWLDVSELGGPEYEGSHSNGLKDQFLALKWIRDNISQFGGDADNITVIGESAGSIDLSWLLTNGYLNDIAKRVVLMSGIAGLIGLSGDLRQGFTEEYSKADSRKLLEDLNIRSMGDLASLSTEDLMERVTKIVRSSDTLFYMDSIFWPRMSRFTPVDPFRADKRKINPEIEIVIGYTSYEMGLWLTWDEILDRHSCKWAAGKIQDVRTDQRSEIASLYRQALPETEDGQRALYMIGDSIFVMPALWFAEQLAEAGIGVRVYQFDWQTDSRRKAMHAADQTFLFNSLDTQAGRHICGVAQDDAEKESRYRLVRAIQDAILGFSETGDPNAKKNGDLPRWPRYDLSDRAVMSFDLANSITDDPVKSRREWWFENIYGPALLS